MPDIGSTLREARMRARIDISEIEAETKIRAKYLRALENEEWDLLPGPTYVKTFLRTYAEALGLDAKLLVEEYKLRHERPSEAELRPIRPPSAGSRRRPPAGPVIPPWVVIGAVVLVLLASLWGIGVLFGDDDEEPTNAVPPSATQTQPTTATAPEEAERPKRPRTTPRLASVTIIATGPVFVCLRAAGNRTLVDGETLVAGQRRGPFRSSSFKMTLGNNNARLRIGSRTVSVAPSDEPIGLRITRRGRTPLAAAERPTCS